MNKEALLKEKYKSAFNDELEKLAAPFQASSVARGLAKVKNTKRLKDLSRRLTEGAWKADEINEAALRKLTSGKKLSIKNREKLNKTVSNTGKRMGARFSAAAEAKKLSKNPKQLFARMGDFDTIDYV